MPPFASDRERRLWRWALLVVVAIYATLGLAGTLVGVLRSEGLLGAMFGLGFLLVILAIAGAAWTRKPGRNERWMAVGIAAAYVMIVVRMGVSPTERTHIFEYGLVAVLVHQALLERRKHRPVPVPAILAVVLTALVGWVDEGIQWLLPNRVYDPLDVARNGLAALIAVVASLLVGLARRLDRRGMGA